ncbi:MAG TPA: hypothetical protein VMT87_08665 [Vicinamibacteria bacterium]|nr:hypothetical protein [Vicinamibacteria bacterium]
MTSAGVRGLRVVLGLALLPLAAGWINVTYQDASMTHLPGKWATVDLLRKGEFPYLNPYASFGQPLAGNPNFGTFFPDTLAFLVLPVHTAFGLHFALAALLAYAGARRWARAEGHGRGAAEAAAVAFTLSGVFVSAWKFYNTGMALAVAPWVLAATAKALRRAAEPEGRRVRPAVAELGAWSALEVFAGEPVVALLTFLLAGVRTAAAPSRRGLLAVAGALALGALLAGPQVLLTAQIYRDSSREERSYPFVTATGTSVHPIRFVEQAVPFPFGRPDLAGRGRFTGHAFHDNHTPYLWTLHLGLATLALLVRHGRPWRGAERLWYATALVAVVLSFGRYLPLAKKLYPLLSLDGRLRFPVKWWYVVALCLVPLVAHAAHRWAAGERPNRASGGVLVVLAAVALGLAIHFDADGMAFNALLMAVAAAIALFFSRRPRPAAWLPAVLTAPLVAAHLPLLLAVLDRPLSAPPRVAGRVFERIAVDTHALPGAVLPAEDTTRAVMRRITPELWAISGALAGVRYAFDRDPDGSYTDPDRVVRKELDALPWPERVPRLRHSGVALVVTDGVLPEPFRLSRVLSPTHGVRLYALGGAAPPVRLAAGRFLSVRERTTALSAEVIADAPGLLVWSRSYFEAWRATVDGQPAEVVLADGHVVGVPVPAGRHRVEVAWPAWPLRTGAVLFTAGALAAAWLRRRP